MWQLAIILTISLSFILHCHGKPHIVFIVADDLGFNDIGYHAIQHMLDMKTPYLDSLALSGAKLENYYVQPICTPSRSVLMSGRYQIHTGLQHYVITPQQRNGVPLENVLLPEQLQQCGYDTFMVGKWHLGFYKDEYVPWKRGFNKYYGYFTSAEDYFVRLRCDEVDYCGFDIESENGPANPEIGEYSAHLYARKAIEMIDKRNTTQPMFLYLAFQSVHNPLQAPKEYVKQFEYINDKNRRTYGGMVSALDEAVKNVTEHLKSVGMWENAILIFSTDNGGQTLYGGNNYPLRGRKLTLWEGGIRGVGFVSSPLFNFPKENKIPNKEMIHIADWYPTIMSASQCPYIKGSQALDGFDQWDTIAKYAPSKRNEFLLNIDPLYTPMFTATKFRHDTIKMGFDTAVHAGIRSGEWKLLTGEQGDDRWIEPPEHENNATIKWSQEDPDHPGYQRYNAKLVQLYNVQQDPLEKNEVSEYYPEIVDTLLAKLANYNATAVPVRFPKSDHLSDPALHEGYWQPWVQ